MGGGYVDQGVVTYYSVINTKTVLQTKIPIPQSQSVHFGKIREDRCTKNAPEEPPLLLVLFAAWNAPLVSLTKLEGNAPLNFDRMTSQLLNMSLPLVSQSYPWSHDPKNFKRIETGTDRIDGGKQSMLLA